MVQGNETEGSDVPGLRAGALLALRYRIEGPAPNGIPGVFIGRDEQSQARVHAFEVDSSDAIAIAPAARITHAHLAPVLELAHLPGETGRLVIVSEFVQGKSLAELLAQISKKSHVDAVRSALRVADALCALHAAGGAHGGVNDRTLIVQPRAHAAPTLLLGPRNSSDSPYRRPGDHGPPSEADDSWATAALLYHMLTGHPPPREGIETTDDLDLTELEDPALCEALAHGLSKDDERRSPDLRPLKRELARWFVDHAGEEVLPVSTRSSQPPPLPNSPSQPPPASISPGRPPVPVLISSMPPASARKPSRRISLLAFGGIMLGLATAWGVSRVRERPRVELVPISKPAGKVAQQSAAIDLSEVPVTGEKQAATGDKLSTCVAGYLPRGAFAKPPDLSALCSEQDPRAGTAKLHAAIASGARAGAEPTAAMKIWSRLGWHELLAFSVIRSGCCPDAKPLSLPNPSSGCPAMDAPLREVGKAVVNNQNYETPLKAFSDAITCEAGHGRAALYGRTGKPDPAEEAAFLELVKAVQAP